MPSHHTTSDPNAPSSDPAPPSRDTGTPETRDKRIRQITTPPVDRYFQRGEITQQQHITALRLYTHFHHAGLFPSSVPTTAFATPIARQSGDPSFTERQVEHRQMWRDALNAVTSKSAKLVVLNVVCYGFFVRDLQMSYYKTPTQIMPLLREALDEIFGYWEKTKT